MSRVQRWGVVVALVMLGSGACSGPDTAPGDASASSGAAVSSSSPEALVVTQAALVAEPSAGFATRYEAKPGSSWWVSVGVVRNRAKVALTLSGLALAGTQVTGLRDDQQAVVLPLNGAAIVDAYWPAEGDRVRGQPLENSVIAPGARVQVAMRVSLLAAQNGTPMPLMELSYAASAAAGSVRLDPGFAFQSGPLPSPS